MVTHSNKQIEEQFATVFHLRLHRAAALEGAAAANDESEIMSSKLRVAVGGVGVGPTS